MTVPGALSVALIVANSDLVGVMPARLADSVCGLFQLAMFELPEGHDNSSFSGVSAVERAPLGPVRQPCFAACAISGRSSG